MIEKPYIELLAPAGGPDQFRAALAAGADAIYCGVGNDFNARRSADNFTLETFEAACREAHLAGVRVYVTLNVVIKDSELARAMQLVHDCAVRGTDAFIIQDWGLLALIHKTWPEIELHVSTQANIHDGRGLALAAELGAKRVTLSRELSGAEIGLMSNSVAKALGIELEVFGHGALCFCYSGLCLLSSTMGGRSANRGLCAQPCRLLYELVDAQGHTLNAPERTRPLCPKDACAVQDIAALIYNGAGALKIEGRMKAPDYVYNVVSAYRAQIDATYAAFVAGEVPRDEALMLEPSKRPVDPEIKRQLKRAFNRDFTNAYLHGTSGDELMSYERSNNRGELVGEVVACAGNQQQRRDGKGNLHKDPRQNKKYATCSVQIQLSESVGAGDLLELRAPDNFDDFLTAPVTADATAGQTITCKINRPIPVGAQARVIRSKAAHVATAAALAQSVARKRKIAVHVVARLGEPFKVELTCVDGRSLDGKLISDSVAAPYAAAEGFVVESARTKAVTREDLVEHVGRMGTSAFEPVSFEVELDEGVGMSFSAVHKVRAAACEALEQAILAPYTARAQELAPFNEPSLSAASYTSTDLETSQVFTTHNGSLFFQSSETGGKESLGIDIAAQSQLFETPQQPQICVFAPTPELAQIALSAGADRIYVSADALYTAEAAGKAWPCEPIYWREEVRRAVDDWHESLPNGALVSTPSDLSWAMAHAFAFEANSTIPVHNVQTLRFLEQAGATAIWLSPELSLKEIEYLAANAQTAQLGMMVYGRPRVMTSEHCVLQAANRCIHNCEQCKLRAQAQTAGVLLKNKDGKLLPVQTDAHGRSRIYGPEVLDLVPEVPRFVYGLPRLANQALAVGYLGVDATLLTSEQTHAAVVRLRAALSSATSITREPGATSGHLYDPIG